MAKCPKCDRTFSTVNYGEVDIKILGEKRYNGVVLACPHCDVALNVVFDPVALAHESKDRDNKRKPPQ